MTQDYVPETIPGPRPMTSATPQSVKVLSIMLSTGLSEREARSILAEREAMTERPAATYAEACRKAATDQGLDPATEALRAAGVEHEVAQTGGFCMVVEIPTGHGEAYLGVTAAAMYDGGEGFAVFSYPDREGEDEGTELALHATPAEVVAIVRAEQAEDGR